MGYGHPPLKMDNVLAAIFDNGRAIRQNMSCSTIKLITHFIYRFV